MLVGYFRFQHFGSLRNLRNRPALVTIERREIAFYIVFGIDAMIDSSLIAELLAAAVLFTGYPATTLENLPEVRQLSPGEMVREICPENPQACHGIVAQFD